MNFHSSILPKLAKLKTFRNIRKYLKKIGLTHSEQNAVIRELKKDYEII